MVETTRRWTVAEVMAIPYDGKRYEVVHGELLVTPSPAQRHELARTRLFMRIADSGRAAGRADTLFIQSDVFDADDVYVQPDLMIADPATVTGDWRDIKRPLLVVEILSPSSRRGDRDVKRPAYQAMGAATYWIVDPEHRTVEVWHPEDTEPQVVTETVRWRIAPDAPMLEIPLAEIFQGLPD
jgi:Uma2 family endonuclease